MVHSEFRTVVAIPPGKWKIHVDSRILLIGSCFAQNMGEHFHQARFNVRVNPLGIVYNPVSVAQSINRLIYSKKVDEAALLENNGLWHHFDFHGQFSDPDKSVAVQKMNEAVAEGHRFLKTSRFLFLTLGTSHVFQHLETGKVVANCHKFPNSLFKRYRLDPGEIAARLIALLDEVEAFNPGLKVIFTVSPVRHLRDDAHGNQLSKAALFLAIDQVMKVRRHTSYFPSYEIVMDELRDYRFYDDGMIHPSARAVGYVWKRFADAWLSDSAREYAEQTRKIVAARSHKLQSPFIASGFAFAENMMARIEEIEKKFPVTFLGEDKDYFRSVLSQRT